MRVCIHRGTQEIGGTCIEIEAGGRRLVLEVGLLLDTPETEEVMAPVPGFFSMARIGVAIEVL